VTDFEAGAAPREEDDAAIDAAPGQTGLRNVEPSWDLEVIDDVEHDRWIATLGADAIAELTYRFVGGRVVLLHTWSTPPIAVIGWPLSLPLACCTKSARAGRRSPSSARSWVRSSPEPGIARSHR
jgi:hypothetical protein